MKRLVKTIVIANIAEYYLPTFQSFGEKEIRAWVEPSYGESDMALFWGGDDKLVITSFPPDERFIDEVRRTLPYSNLQVASPKSPSTSLCNDILAEPALFEQMIAVLSSADSVDILVWGATKQLYVLLDKLLATGISFPPPQIPCRENYWTARYLDSKSGFRDFCGKLSNEAVRIPRGFICADIEIAARVAKSHAVGRGVCVKANESVGGYGVLLFPADRVNQSKNLEAQITMSARMFPILSKGVVIVEDFVETSSCPYLAAPSIQLSVDESGCCHNIALAAQIIDRNGKYVGAAISPEIFPQQVVQALEASGKVIGQAVSGIGYRGIFNIDALLDRNHQLYCVELNARRTSVTYTLDLARYLFGPSFSESVTILTNERFTSSTLHKHSYTSILSLLSDFQFPMNGKKQGVLVTITSSLVHFARVPHVGFIVVAEDLVTAEYIFNNVCRLLGTE